MPTLQPLIIGLLPWLLYAALMAMLLVGLFLNILGLPGLWLMVVAAVAYGWWFDFAYIGYWTIGILVALGALAELIEFAAAAAGSKQAGGSKRGMAGAIVGGIVGGLLGTVVMPIPVLGTVVGSIAGCFVGTYPIEYAIGRSHRDAAVIGYGAAKGRLFGLVAKTAVGLAMAIIAALMGVPARFGESRPTTTAPSTQATLTTAS